MGEESASGNIMSCCLQANHGQRAKRSPHELSCRKTRKQAVETGIGEDRSDGSNERRRQAEANYSHGKINKIGLPKKIDAWQERAFVWEKFVMLGDDGANFCFKRAEAML